MYGAWVETPKLRFDVYVVVAEASPLDEAAFEAFGFGLAAAFGKSRSKMDPRPASSSYSSSSSSSSASCASVGPMMAASD